MNLKLDNETRLSAVESGLSGNASSNNTHSMNDITDYTAPDLSKYATINHTHKLDEVVFEYEEEETFEEETVNEEEEVIVVNRTRTINKQKGLNELLDGKSNVGHNHSISDITNLQTTLDSKASTNHNHDNTYASISHNHSLNYYVS